MYWALIDEIIPDMINDFGMGFIQHLHFLRDTGWALISLGSYFIICKYEESTTSSVSPTERRRLCYFVLMLSLILSLMMHIEGSEIWSQMNYSVRILIYEQEIHRCSAKLLTSLQAVST